MWEVVMSAKDNRKEEENILNEVFNLDLYEFVDEYTDKGSGKASEQMPDFYLRSKKEGLPDLAIEVKTLRRDYDRSADYETPPEVEEHHLSVKDFHVVLKLDLLVYKNPPPMKVKRVWDSLKKELDKYKEKWESILDRISDIEKLLENEDKDIYVKDPPHEKKDELRKIIEDIKRQDERFLKYNITYFTYLCLDMHAEICQEKIGDVKTTIQNNKEEGLKWRIEDFLKTYFSKELGISPDKVVVDKESSGNGFIFPIRFVLHWKVEEEVKFYMEEIGSYVERSKGKFEHLRKVKSDKSDGSSHLELLLVKGSLVADRDFNSFIEKIKAELTKKGYDCLLCIRKRKEGEDDEFITIEIKNGTVRSSGGSWDGNYYLIIRMDNGMGDDWKTQISGILNEVLKVV
jgi:hypothetical protein